jgi:thymidylate synthase (FAD)
MPMGADVMKSLRHTNVLDAGYVVLHAVMGDDLTPVDAARISYGTGRKGDVADNKLLKYLYTNQHMTPFEMITLLWEVKCPLFIRSQWHRHRAASYNEFSQRYADPAKLSDSDTADFYMPNVWRKRDEVNPQGSVEPEGYDFDQDLLTGLYNDLYTHAQEVYTTAVNMGIAREQARIGMPVATYTKFFYKVDMRNFLHFLELRMKKNAQWEMQQYANAMHNIAWEQFPRIMNLFDGDIEEEL